MRTLFLVIALAVSAATAQSQKQVTNAAVRLPLGAAIFENEWSRLELVGVSENPLTATFTLTRSYSGKVTGLSTSFVLVQGQTQAVLVFDELGFGGLRKDQWVVKLFIHDIEPSGHVSVIYSAHRVRRQS